ncbi:unnamed protein product [Orchesella dallaii]|uniref:Ubiquitin carboxyl-terminal hydrolase CYLD n=1 Tax=Orchesella dallaii TaxID=48710 RepID=A0ABP1RH16_9HEXA
MGGQPSKERKRELLQQKILCYLKSSNEEDYKKNPSKAFSSVRSLGFKNVEDFIKNIRLTEAVTLSQNHPEGRKGMRYVVKSNPAKRGTLVKSRNIDRPDLATLKMDRERGRNPLHCAPRRKLVNFSFDQLEPEKVYYQSFLMDPFSQSSFLRKSVEKDNLLETASTTIATTQLPKPPKEPANKPISSKKRSTEKLPVSKDSNDTRKAQKVNTLPFEMELTQTTDSEKCFEEEFSLPNLDDSNEGIVENYDLQSAPFVDESKIDTNPPDSPLESKAEPTVACFAGTEPNFNAPNLDAEDMAAQQIDNFESEAKPDETLESGPDVSKMDQQALENSIERVSNEVLENNNENQLQGATTIRSCLKRTLSNESNHENLPSKKLNSSSKLHDKNLNDESIPNLFIGTSKGIEGYSNSCYMDSMLVSMFYCTAAFNGILKQKEADSKYASLARKYLRDNIVKPLRKKYYCTSESAMKLRQHLSQLDGDILGSFMDVEQLLYLLFDDALKEREFIQYTDGGGDFMHQTSIDNNDKSKSITVQKNLETSMKINGDLKFQSVPNPALIVGLPRSNGRFVQYFSVIPNTELDISGLIESVKCDSCNEIANWEKLDRQNVQPPIPCCDSCSAIIISKNLDNYCVIASRMKMRLSAIICVRASHFTAFVRNQMGTSEWLFFDSMSGKGPEIKIVKNLDVWLNNLTKQPNRSLKFLFQKKPNANTLLKQRTCSDGHMVIYEQISYPG